MRSRVMRIGASGYVCVICKGINKQSDFYSRSDPQFGSTPDEQKESQRATRLASPRVLTATRVKC
jgi:hypothetical protein